MRSSRCPCWSRRSDQAGSDHDRSLMLVQTRRGEGRSRDNRRAHPLSRAESRQPPRPPPVPRPDRDPNGSDRPCSANARLVRKISIRSLAGAAASGIGTWLQRSHGKAGARIIRACRADRANLAESSRSTCRRRPTAARGRLPANRGGSCPWLVASLWFRWKAALTCGGAPHPFHSRSSKYYPSRPEPRRHFLMPGRPADCCRA